MKLQMSAGRGNLPLQMKITIRDGEEHLSYRGTMMADYAARQIAKWILTSEEEVRPTQNLTVVLKANLRGIDHYWIPGGQLDAETVYNLVGTTPLMPEDRQKILYAHQILLYNLERESEAAKFCPLAEITHRLGSSSELKVLYCSISEAAGMIYALKALRTNDKWDGVVMHNFFSQVPLKKLVPEAPTKVVDFRAQSNLSRSASEIIGANDRENAELIRRIEKRIGY